MIIYFSGTGNSRFIAEAAADILHDEAVRSNDFIKRGEKGNFRSEKPWVFVFPVYVSAPAQIFADFLNSSEFSGNTGAYFIATCASAMGITPNVCGEFCKAKGLEYMGAEKIKMPQNYIALFTMHDEEECRSRIASAREAVKGICAVISEGGKLEGKAVSKAEYAVTKWVEKLYNGRFTKSDKFIATNKCVGCGLCESSCPVNGVRINNGRPHWTGKCVHCMSCINLCPKQAIEYGGKTAGKRRYVCEKYK